MADSLKTAAATDVVMSAVEDAGELEVAPALPFDPEDAPEVAASRKNAGRPKGARNRRTRELRDYLLANYAHPLEVLAQCISKRVEVIAAELKCDLLDAAKFQQSAAKELAPYLEQKLPIAVQIQERIYQLIINDPPAANDHAGLPDEGEQNGVVIDAKVMN